MQPKILSIDSAGTLCSVACSGFCKETFLESKPGQKHTEILLGMIDEVLTEAGGSLKELDAVAFGSGPGAFTGLRVACGTAQGIGWALKKPLIAVPNLEAIAYTVFEPYATGSRLFVAVDARMSECYCQAFEKTADGLKSLNECCLQKPDTLLGDARELECTIFTGNGFSAYNIEIQPEDGIFRSDIGLADAQMLMKVALKYFEEKKTILPEHASPLYVRNHVAMTIEERLQLHRK